MLESCVNPLCGCITKQPLVFKPFICPSDTFNMPLFFPRKVFFDESNPAAYICDVKGKLYSHIIEYILQIYILIYYFALTVYQNYQYFYSWNYISYYKINETFSQLTNLKHQCCCHEHIQLLLSGPHTVLYWSLLLM